MHTEGTRIYAQSQQLYGELVDASRAGVGFAPLGYGVGSVPLVDVALRCCAQGRLLASMTDLLFEMCPVVFPSLASPVDR